MVTLKFDQKQLDTLELYTGLFYLSEEYDFELGDGIVVTLQDTKNDDLTVELKDNEATLSFDFGRRFLFFRALSHVLQAISEGKDSVSVKETAAFDRIGPLLDLAQGDMCLNMKTMQDLLKKQAVMGFGMCMLYMEDNFEVPEEPYFGQMRPRYSYDELKAIDDYAYALGIEVIPAVQALSHQSTVMVWDTYKPIRENNRTLLPGEPKTYEFLRHVLTASTKPFRSKKVHLGLEECDHLGHGGYFKQHGMVDAGQIIVDHLAKVVEICKELDIQPLAWDQQFFKTLVKEKSGTPEQMATLRKITEDLDMVHYSYSAKDTAFFERRIDKHNTDWSLNWFCPTMWTWLGFGPNWEITRGNATCVAACRNKGLRNLIVSIWEIGYDCDWRVNHYGLQLYAELAYNANPTEDEFRNRFKFCCKGNWDDFTLLHELDCVPSVPDHNKVDHPSDATEFLLWQDPLCGLFDKDIEGLNINAHFEALEPQIAAAVKRAEGTIYEEMFEHYRLLASALALKSDLGNNIRDAYMAGDKKELARLAEEIVPETYRRVQALRANHRKCWRHCGKPLGWEIYDLHYGAVLARLDSAAALMGEYLDGTIEDLGEVAAPRLSYKRGGFGHAGKIPSWTDKWGRVVSASMVCPEYWLALPDGHNTEDVG